MPNPAAFCQRLPVFCARARVTVFPDVARLEISVLLDKAPPPTVMGSHENGRLHTKKKIIWTSPWHEGEVTKKDLHPLTGQVWVFLDSFFQYYGVLTWGFAKLLRPFWVWFGSEPTS